jgi:hypothetical protein
MSGCLATSRGPTWIETAWTIVCRPLNVDGPGAEKWRRRDTSSSCDLGPAINRGQR